LSCALRVLQEEARPLNCPEMVKIMLEKGYWKTDGKTPAATIYSAILMEIKKKGADARFRKTERGKFELAAK
jgi:restriction system protein